MNVSTTIPATVQIRRGRLLGLIGAVAVLAAAITSALLVFAVDVGSTDVTAESATPALSAQEQGYLDMLPIPPSSLEGFSVIAGPGTKSGAQLRAIRNYHAFGASGSLTPAQVRSIGSYLFGVSGSFTPAQLRAIRNYHAFGASGALTPAELRSIRSYLLGASAGR
jgi:hypothetical protein